MKINYNVSAAIANKHLLGIEDNLSTTMERLSSGLKINHSKDNPAGMAISSKMKAQIDGLNRASENASDGVSVIQIADGALNETTSILQRMRELSVQAASDATMTPADREAIQKEIASLKQEVDRDKEVPDFTPTSAYFGRILLFLIIGLIQGAIVCAGDIILLKVQCLHPVKFILAGMLTSFVYVNLIFALASTFKHMGKALAVLLVILQIPGSSGTYPIEMMPEFFQKLHPLLPFSYSISAMRECIAGYYHHTYRSSLGKLLVFLLVALFIGLVLRPLLMNLNHLFDVRLAETDLMICETDSKGRDNPQLQRIMQVIMKDDAWRKKLTEKTLAFEKYYPVMVRSGFICMMVIPLVFLILMFSLESKLVYLILWIVSLLALILYLLIVEYLHEEMKKKSVLGEMSSEELMKILKEENSK